MLHYIVWAVSFDLCTSTKGLGAAAAAPPGHGEQGSAAVKNSPTVGYEQELQLNQINSTNSNVEGNMGFMCKRTEPAINY
ncbi:hypothetical protein EYF80_037139 [Liparis tanakae]|uniref:Uncharacterized protein n=1 Tax=Liparis tanakae TaxID=230148 RepID=A0A4Z2GGT3_9TELE|nr:hypothetical protein EYF80_037139 [Liparis tanakae]